MNESIKRYFISRTDRRSNTVDDMSVFQDRKILPAVTGDLSCTTSDGEIKKLYPFGVKYFDVLNLRRYLLVSLIKTALAKGYVKELTDVKVDFYKGRYGRGFICDCHNKESKNYVKRLYYCFNNAKIPKDGFILMFNYSYAGEDGKNLLTSVFEKMQKEKVRLMEFQIAKDVLQIYNVNAF